MELAGAFVQLYLEETTVPVRFHMIFAFETKTTVILPITLSVACLPNKCKIS